MFDPAPQTVTRQAEADDTEDAALLIALMRTRAMINSPKKWCQHAGHIAGARCLGSALWRACGHDDELFERAHHALGFAAAGDIPLWNDNYRRTHAQVLARLGAAERAVRCPGGSA